MFQWSVSDLKQEVWSMDEISCKKIIEETKNPFWREVFKAWSKYSESSVRNNVLAYPIWNIFMKKIKMYCIERRSL